MLFRSGIELSINPGQDVETYTYALEQKADFYAENIEIRNHRYHYDLVVPEGRIRNMSPGLSGLFNVENSIAAAAAAWLSGASADEIRDGAKTFAGVRRRFDIRINLPGLLYIDDYAHHPQELNACIMSVRKLYPDRHITGIFQPHLYSRTRDFAKEFAKSLSLLDRVILLDIYPAREKPIEGITSEILMDSIQTTNKILCSKAQALQAISDNPPDILLTLGAGDIDQLAEPIETLFTKKPKL